MSTAEINDDEREDKNLSQERNAEESETDSNETGENEPDRHGGIFLTASEDFEEGDEETDYLVENLIPKDSMILLTAQPKVGKTTYVLCLVKSLIEGTDFLGSEVEQTDVLYLTQQPLPSFKSEYVFEHGLENSEGLHYASESATFDFDLKELMKRVAVAANETGAGFLVIDTFTSFTGLEADEENSSGEVKAALQTIRQCCSAVGLTVIVVHHNRKGGGSITESSRGSNVFSAEPDVLFGLRKDSGQNNARKLLSTGRFSEIPEYQRIALQEEGYKTLGSSSGGRDEVTKVISDMLPAAKAQAVKKKEMLDILEQEGWDVAKSTVGRKLDHLVDSEDSVRQFEGGGRGNPHLYYRDLGESWSASSAEDAGEEDAGEEDPDVESPDGDDV
jgi:predicted ATP-dependent serine protease